MQFIHIYEKDRRHEIQDHSLLSVASYNTKEILPFGKLSSRKDNETRYGVTVKVSDCVKVISVLDAIVAGITVDLSLMKLISKHLLSS